MQNAHHRADLDIYATIQIFGYILISRSNLNITIIYRLPLLIKYLVTKTGVAIHFISSFQIFL